MFEQIVEPLLRAAQQLLIIGIIAFGALFAVAVLSYFIGYYWTLGRHRGLVKALREREHTEEPNHGT